MQKRTVSSDKRTESKERVRGAQIVRGLTPQKQYDLVRMLPQMTRDHSARAAKYFAVLKAIILDKVKYLPDDIVVRPAADYAHLIAKARSPPPGFFGVAIPVDASMDIKDGALVIEYHRVLVVWFTPTCVQAEHYRLPPQRAVSHAAARDRVAQFLMEFARPELKTSP